MKKYITSILLLICFQSFAQLSGKTVTTITLKMGDLNTTFQKFKESEWKMIQKGSDGSNTEIRFLMYLMLMTIQLHLNKRNLEQI